MNKSIIGLYVEILSACNQHCLYCYNEEYLYKGHSFTIDLFDKLTCDIKTIGLSSLSISGGEPFLHKDLSNFILNAISKDLHLSIITNATIYNHNLYKLLCEYSIPLQITLDGADPQTHDYTRGIGTFQKIISNIDALYNLGYTGVLSVRMNLHKKNYLYIKDVALLSQKIGASSISLSLINTVGGGQSFNDLITESDFDLLEHVAILAENLQKGLNINVTFEGLNSSIGCPFYSIDNIECGLRISSDGYVYPCQLFNDKIFNIGNIKHNTLIEIINSERMDNFLSLMKLRKFYIPECNECAYKCMCYTGCPAEAYNKNHNIFTNCGKCNRNKNVFNKVVHKILVNATGLN